MTPHRATIDWERRDAVFVDHRYSRGHRWEFDGGVQVPASSSPHVVPIPYSVPAAVDPEEAFVAAISSCHMLWFLALAAKRGHVVDRYRDDAAGVVDRGPDGKQFVREVVLQPAVTFGDASGPTAAELDALHHAAHEACYIANSVRTVVRCVPRHGHAG